MGRSITLIMWERSYMLNAMYMCYVYVKAQCKLIGGKYVARHAAQSSYFWLRDRRNH